MDAGVMGSKVVSEDTMDLATLSTVFGGGICGGVGGKG
jgi:hypothetical protein